MISLKNITKEIPRGVLLDSISFTLGNNEKVGLIGQNGCGKSTLLKIILGEEEYEQGHMQIQGERIGYLPQLFSFPKDKTIHEYGDSLFGKENVYAFERALSKLGLEETYFDTAVSALSSGQKMRVMLASLLQKDPTVLILDEPTNHLDIDGVLWMEDFVSSFDGIVLMVSHDRAFLDNTATHIFEIDEKKLHIFPGNYSDYVRQKEHWVDERDKAFRRQEQKRMQLETLLENARKIKGGKSRGKAVRSAKKRMEREVLKNEIDAYKRDIVEDLSLEGKTHTGKLMLRVENLSKAYNKNIIFSDAGFEIRGNSRVWLFGQNGVGKSTLLNSITGIIKSDKGQVTIGEQVKWGYFRQNQEQLDLEMTVKMFIETETDIRRPKIYGFLQQFIFPKSFLSKKLKTLSPGERARLAFGVFSQQQLDLLILDEPTNHLDIWTKEAIEKSLKEYKGALLLVSHDRYFVEQVDVDRMVTIDDGKIVEAWN